MFIKKSFSATLESVPEIVSFVVEKISLLKLQRKELIREQLRIEDVAAKLIEYTKEGSDIQITVLSYLNHYEIRLSCPGKAITLTELKQDYNDLLDEDEDTNDFIRRWATSILSKNIKLQSHKNINRCTLIKQKTERNRLLLILMALVLGALMGLVLNFIVPDSVSKVISTDIFGSASQMFLSAMKMVVAPLVFFSISASIADFGDLKALGKIAIKVFGCYLATSLLAIFVGYFTCRLIPIGDPSLMTLVEDYSGESIATSSTVSVSLKDTILGIIPTNIITPFLESDMLQIMFVAVLVGIAASALSNEHKIFKDIIFSANAVFSKITSIIVMFMPIAVFCNMAKMVAEFNASVFASVALWVLVCYLGYLFMIAIYGLLILTAGLNPLKFYKGFIPVSLTSFSLCSSLATVPLSVKACDEKLGISKRLYSFSIPFGATMNMDGSCITMVVTSVFMVNIFGISVTPAMLFTLGISILLLSIGAPGVPGAGFVCLSILLPQVGIPADALCIILGLYTLVSMGQTLCNCTGDAAITTFVAKHEKLIDIQKYNAN